MRDVYYQSAGNPVQVDRLPATRPDAEMLPPALPTHELFKRIMGQHSVATAVAFCLLIMYRAPGWQLLEPFDLIAGVASLAVGLGFAITCRDLRWLLNPVVLFGLGLLCLNQRMPWAGHIVFAALAMGGFTFAFGWHWVVISTASPLSRTAAEDLRARCYGYLCLAATVVAVLTAALVTWDSTLLRLAIVSLVAATAVVPHPGRFFFARWQTLRNSWLSWLTYEAQPLPGLLQSPCGSLHQRLALTLGAIVLTALIFVRWSGSPLSTVIDFSQNQHQQTSAQLDSARADHFTRFRYGAALWIVTVVCVVSLPVVTPFVIASAAAMPALLTAATAQEKAAAENGVSSIMEDIRRSSDRTERDSVYHGRVVADGSPVYVPRAVYGEHAHGLGDSGSGKTSLFLCPIIEQLVTFGDCSLIVLDLKADTPELFATLQSAGESVRRERGVRLPLKYFSNQTGKATFAFNPMTQPFWSNFDLFTRTDILCGATGLNYGTDYGSGYYSSANAAILHHTLKTFPNVTTFAELADCIGNVVATAKKSELHPEIRKAGVHVHEVIKRLAACEALNVTSATGHDKDVVDHSIDVTQVFREPQLHYFHLSSTLSPSGAPEIARLITYMLLAASTQTERRCPVYLVIDEFQRMVASNLEYMLQLARSMGIGVILANQSLEDLKKGTTNLIPAIEANCRLRQWFSVSSSEDQERLMRSSGLTVDRTLSRSVSMNHEGRQSHSFSVSEQVVNRLTLNDVLLASDHPFRSILRISRGSGYAQYGGMTVIIESQYHISRAEYQRRKSIPWPSDPGTFVAGRQPPPAASGVTTTSPTPSSGPQWSEEVIGTTAPQPLSVTQQASVEELFRQFQQALPAPAPRKKRRPKP